MKRITLTLMLLSQLCHADVFTKRFDFSSVNLGASFVAVPELSGIRNPQAVFINNRMSSGEFVLNCHEVAGTPADNGVGSDGKDHNMYVNATEGYSFSLPNITSRCFARSYSGTLSTGIVVVNITGG